MWEHASVKKKSQLRSLSKAEHGLRSSILPDCGMFPQKHRPLNRDTDLMRSTAKKERRRTCLRHHQLGDQRNSQSTKRLPFEQSKASVCWKTSFTFAIHCPPITTIFRKPSGMVKMLLPLMLAACCCKQGTIPPAQTNIQATSVTLFT